MTLRLWTLLNTTRMQYEFMPADEETALSYAKLYRDLRERSCLIGANDLWIAAHALRHDLPLVTRNLAEFERVPGLRVMTY